MVVNPFFLHGSTSEQNLMQDLVNEQLRMYGIDVYYIPREFIREATIMREVTSSEFRSYFIIEAYLNNVDGYAGQGSLMSKFGIQMKDEVTLTISRERYTEYIAPFLQTRLLYQLASLDTPKETKNGVTLENVYRPREGDLIYFPLGRRLFEIKLVETENPFYQLGKNYTYELQCELFEYEDEVLDTSIDEIDTVIDDNGHITTLNMVAISDRATVTPVIGSGYIRNITIINEGTGFTETPNVIVDPPEVGIDPNIVSTITKPNQNTNSSSLKDLIVFHSGQGYTEAPNITIQGTGRNAEVSCEINTGSDGILEFEVSYSGSGYTEDVAITVYDENNLPVASGLALSDGKKIVAAVVTDPGEALDENITAIVDAPPNAGAGDFIYNEMIVGQKSGTKARVRDWNAITKILEITNTARNDGNIFFTPGEIVVGQTSGATYAVESYDDNISEKDAYADNDTIEEEAQSIVDFSEYNPFGEY